MLITKKLSSLKNQPETVGCAIQKSVSAKTRPMAARWHSPKLTNRPAPKNPLFAIFGF